MRGYDPADWQSFLVAVVGAAAALTGLLFVAVSMFVPAPSARKLWFNTYPLENKYTKSRLFPRFHTAGRGSLQFRRSQCGCPGSRTITQSRGGGHVENQTRQDHYRYRSRGGCAWRGVGRQPCCGQRRDKPLVHIGVDHIIVDNGNDGGQCRVYKHGSDSHAVRHAQWHAQVPEHEGRARHAGRAGEFKHRQLGLR
jgi:hypothetical protein